MIVTWTIRWANPYTKPPEGKPEVLFQITKHVTSTTERPVELERYQTIGTGYAVYVQVQPPQPRARLSLEQKQKIRRQRLKRRLDRKFPLYAAALYAEMVTEKPDYYGGAEKD